jgi:hypothetical protein
MKTWSMLRIVCAHMRNRIEASFLHFRISCTGMDKCPPRLKVYLGYPMWFTKNNSTCNTFGRPTTGVTMIHCSKGHGTKSRQVPCLRGDFTRASAACLWCAITQAIGSSVSLYMQREGLKSCRCSSEPSSVVNRILMIVFSLPAVDCHRNTDLFRTPAHVTMVFRKLNASSPRGPLRAIRGQTLLTIFEQVLISRLCLCQPAVNTGICQRIHGRLDRPQAF